MDSYRYAMAEAVQKAVEEYPNVYVITADLARAEKLDNLLLPGQQYIPVGISENNMMCMAAGLSTTGLIPIIVGFAMFTACRSFEQIRNTIAYSNFNVKIIATHGGICVGKDGATHQAMEDLALMRVLPNMTVLCASDAAQTKAAIQTMIEHKGPVYLRLGRDATPQIYDTMPEVRIGGSDLLKEGKDILIIGTGSIVSKALEAAKELERDGIHATVLNTYSIKPLDQSSILHWAKICQSVIVVEDHFTAGGLGSAVCELLCEHNPMPVRRIGIGDTFGESGTEEQLFEKYGIAKRFIIEAAKTMCKKGGKQ